MFSSLGSPALLFLLADECCSDRESCRRRKEIKADISAPSPHLVRVILFCPRSNIQNLLFSSSPSLSLRLVLMASLRDCLSLAVNVSMSMSVHAVFYSFSASLPAPISLHHCSSSLSSLCRVNFTLFSFFLLRVIDPVTMTEEEE